MKKNFEEPKVSVIHFAMQESITWEDGTNEGTDVPGFSVVIDEW